MDRKDLDEIEKKELEYEKTRKHRTISDLSQMGSRERVVKKYWMLDDKTMLKRAFQTIFGNGQLKKRIDKKRIPPFHLEILIKKGYALNLPNLSCCILTDKAFEDKDEILCMKPSEEDS